MQNNEALIERLLKLADRLIDYMGEGATNEEDGRTHASYIATLELINRLTEGESIGSGETIENFEKGSGDGLEDKIGAIEFYVANNISEDSWLHHPGYEKFVDAYHYAMMQTKAIKTLSETSPENLFNTMCIILHKMGFDLNEMSKYV